MGNFRNEGLQQELCAPSAGDQRAKESISNSVILGRSAASKEERKEDSKRLNHCFRWKIGTQHSGVFLCDNLP